MAPAPRQRGRPARSSWRLRLPAFRLRTPGSNSPIDTSNPQSHDEGMSSTVTTPPIQGSWRSDFMIRLFSDLQVARFNELYYQNRSSRMRFLARAANIVSAIAASAVLANLLRAGNALFGWGPAVWQVLTAIAALCAAVGPIFGWEAKATQFEKAALGHAIVRERTHCLLKDLKLSEVDDTHVARSEETEALRMALAALDEPASKRVKEKCWSQTLSEFPSEAAWTLI